ncbi:hypothetical protein ABPG72_006380 [Tetrahymena utriculariae]
MKTIAKQQLTEKALFYSGGLNQLTAFKLPRINKTFEYSQYLEGGNDQNFVNKNKLDQLNQSEIQIQPQNAIHTGGKQSVIQNQSGLSDSIKKQFDYNILHSQQKSRVKLASIMVNLEAKINKSFLDSSKRPSLIGREEINSNKILQNSHLKSQSESVSTNCQTPRRRRFASPLTTSETSNKESRLNKSVCENPSQNFQSPTSLNKSYVLNSGTQSPTKPFNNEINNGIQRVLNECQNAENKKAFTQAYNFPVPNTNNSYTYNPKIRSLSQNDETLLNEFSKLSSNQEQPSKNFITSEPSVDQLFNRGSLQYLDHSAPPNPQHNNSISSLTHIASPLLVSNSHQRSRKTNRYSSIQPQIPSQNSISYERKKRSESIDKQQESTILLRRKNSGISSSSNVTSISKMSENNVIRSLKKMLQNRIKLSQLQIHQDQDCKRLLNHFTNKWYDLISSIQRKDIEHTLFLVIQLLNTLVDLNDINCFLNMLLFISKVYIDFLDYDKALFFLSQGKLICDYTQNQKKKIEFLKQIAECSTGLKDYKASIILLKKALQYAWVLKDTNQETFIYDKLGLNYYYVGDLALSKYYHDKFMDGDYECFDSPNRQMAEQDVQEFFYYLDCKTEGFSRIIFGKLSLPIINIYDNDRVITEQDEYKTKQSFNFINQHGLQNTCDKYKIYNYKTCNGRVLLEQMIKEKEFDFEISTPIYSQLQRKKEERLQFYLDIGEPIQEPKIKKRMALPQVLVKELEKRKKEKEKLEKKNRNFNDPQKYKIPYQVRLKQMMNDKETYESTMDRIRQIVRFTDPNQQQKQQVLLNHLDEDRQKMLNEKIHDPYSLKKKYESLLSDIVAEFILRKNGQNTSGIYII